MSPTSPETFNQVKSILKKLDRSIDNARTRRLGGDEPTDPKPEAHIGANGDQGRPAQQPSPNAPRSTRGKRTRPGSIYGRAKPMRRPGQDG
ncbi:MAG: hypothetical protein AAGD00_03630 [Planctomycetota bacterium]